MHKMEKTWYGENYPVCWLASSSAIVCVTSTPSLLTKSIPNCLDYHSSWPLLTFCEQQGPLLVVPQVYPLLLPTPVKPQVLSGLSILLTSDWDKSRESSGWATVATVKRAMPLRIDGKVHILNYVVGYQVIPLCKGHSTTNPARYKEWRAVSTTVRDRTQRAQCFEQRMKTHWQRRTLFNFFLGSQNTTLPDHLTQLRSIIRFFSYIALATALSLLGVKHARPFPSLIKAARLSWYHAGCWGCNASGVLGKLRDSKSRIFQAQKNSNQG